MPSAASAFVSASTSATASIPKHVRAQLHYLEDNPLYAREKPVQIVPAFLDREKQSNVRLALGAHETIWDVRGRGGGSLAEGEEDGFCLDEHGFRYVTAPTRFCDWASQKGVSEAYLAEVEALLYREVEGADEIVLFDARLRFKEEQGTRVDGLSYNPFARQVHVDQTESSIITKIRALTDLKADFLLSGRVRIINIWRPINHPVYDCALAVADGRSLRPTDVIECDRYRLDNGLFWDTMGVVKYRPGFKWHYMSEQTPDEVLIFKNYDSSRSVTTRNTLHTAFDLEDVPIGAPSRESIEVRALIFTYPARNQDYLRESISEPVIPTAAHHSSLLEELRQLKEENLYYRQENARLRGQFMTERR